MFPYTGVTQLIGASLLFYLAYRFFRIYRTEQYLIGKFFGYTFISFGLIFSALGIPALLFVKQQIVWTICGTVGCVFQILAGAFVGYIIFYMKFPRFRPKWGFILMLAIETLLVTPYFLNPPFYFFEPSGVVNWEIDPLVGILRYLGIFLFLMPVGIIFLQQALTTHERKIKIRAFGIGLGFLWGVIVYLMDLVIINLTNIDIKWADIFLGIAFLCLVIALFLTPKITKHPPWVKFVE